MGSLSNLKILDFTTLLPGPYATLVLADLGAEVLRISSQNRIDLVANWPPMLEHSDTTAVNAWLGRNKKSIFLNLKKQKAIDIIYKLIQDYDILIEQFRPGVMKKLGLDYDTLKKINPKLIYCSITGYGQTGPLSNKAGHDINYLSRSGNMDVAGRKTTGPILSNMQIADMAVGSMNSVVGILAAIEARHTTGKGQYIDISMLDGMIPFNSMGGTCYLAAKKPILREGELLNGGGIYDFYETKDGKYMSVGSLEPKFFAELCHCLGFESWSNGDILKKDTEMVKKAFNIRFKEENQKYWIDLFKDKDACVEPVLSMGEVEHDEHINSRNMLPSVIIPNSNGSKVKQIGCPISLSETPASYIHSGYPLGFHTFSILEALGCSKEEIYDIIN